MTTTPIDYDYFNWLVSQIAVPPDKSFNEMFSIMHNTEFHWTVPNDDNRLQDGIDLRSDFLNGRRAKLHLFGATFLEIVVSLSQRLAFQTSQPANRWAWRLIKNIRLNKMSDPLTREKVSIVKDTLDTLIWRTYREDGRGGFFPLKHPDEDQTKVEIWYQMNKYIIERSSF